MKRSALLQQIADDALSAQYAILEIDRSAGALLEQLRSSLADLAKTRAGLGSHIESLAHIAAGIHEFRGGVVGLVAKIQHFAAQARKN